VTPARADRLRPLLEALVRRCSSVERVSVDPVEFPRRYADPRDAEVVGLLASSLAYGRVGLFKPKIAAIVSALGPRPALTLTRLTAADARLLLEGFTYRFNVAADVAVLLLGMGRCLARRGSLEQVFLDGAIAGDWKQALTAFFESIVSVVDRREVRRELGPERGLRHLLPMGAGAHKRLNLFLRWMVRGPDEVDLGLWPRVNPALLVVPLDTHLARIARLLGLTRREDLSWRTALEVTAALRLVDPEDPVRFDFALCHLGMSAACPLRAGRATCAACLFNADCATGRRLVVRAPRVRRRTPTRAAGGGHFSHPSDETLG
jgi:uncharacterized protein (TIGR02757 family)